MLNPLGYRITFLNSFFAVFSAYLINLTVPRAGDVARATIISKYENIPLLGGVVVLLKKDGTFEEYRIPKEILTIVDKMNVLSHIKK